MDKKKKIIRIALTVLAIYLVMLFFIYIDVVLRARSAYLQGEKYWSWHQNPKQKEQVLEKEKQAKLVKLEEKKKKNKVSEEEYVEEKDFILGEFDWKMAESSIKNAYMWYKTTVDLFQPPRSKYVKMSQSKMKQALELWKKELDKKGIPYKDWMLE